MKLIAGINRQRLFFIINRLLLALAALIILGVLLYAPWRSELMREIQMVFINARLL
jgi:hypothetical protein